MAAVSDVCAGLIRHKTLLLRELTDTNVLDVLVKKGLFSVSDLELITSAGNNDKCNYFIEIVSKQSGVKFNELCSVLEKECPKLSKELKNDKHRFIVNGFTLADSAKENMVMSHNIHRESPRSRRSISQCSCNSVSRRSSVAASPMPLPPLNNTVEMYVEPVVEDVWADEVAKDLRELLLPDWEEVARCREQWRLLLSEAKIHFGVIAPSE